MKYYRILVSTLMTFFLATRSLAMTLEQQETPAPGQYLKHFMAQYPAPEDILVIMDLDDTTITTPRQQLLGRSDAFYHLLNREQKNQPDKSKAEIAAIIDPLLVAVYERVPVIPTDNSLPDVLKNLESRGIKVIGMTARGKHIAEVTHKQLKRADIHFHDTGTLKKIALDDKRTVEIEHGVVMVSHGNKKGESIVALLESGIFSKKPKQIMLIDDRQHHLDNMAAALSQYDKKIPFNPVLCTYLKTMPTFDGKASEEELLAFISHYKNDPEVHQLIKQDAYTQSVIDQCGISFGQNDKYCPILRGINN